MFGRPYLEQLKEAEQCNTDNLKRHWVKNLCNGMKMPTGQLWRPSYWIHWCITIEKRILDKTHSGMCGLSLDEKNKTRGGKAGKDNNGMSPSGEESVGGGEINESFESGQCEGDGDAIDALVLGLPPIPPPPAGPSTLAPPLHGVRDKYNNKEVMPALSARVDISSALRRAERMMKVQKTKHASNKSKEHTSVVNTIGKLLKKADNNSSSVGMSPNMSMTLMQQMEGVVQAWVGRKCLKRYILRLFCDVR
jgi:hypothetical protein